MITFPVSLSENVHYFLCAGKVHLILREAEDSAAEDHYEWNKVTTCVHNLFGGGQRWVDQYGEMIIKNASKGLTCKLSFVRVSLCFTAPLSNQLWHLVFQDVIL